MRKGINCLLVLATSLSGVAFSLSLTACTDIKVKDVKTALQYMVKKQNFTMSYKGNVFKKHDVIYTNKSMGMVSDLYPEITKTYYYDGKGTYKISDNGETTVGSEYKYKGNVWKSGLYSNFYGLDDGFIKDINSSDTEVRIKDKYFKQAFISAIGYEKDDYLSIDSLVASYKNGSLLLDVDFSGYKFQYTVHKFGTSENKLVDNYVKDGGKVLKVSDDLEDFRSAMKGNNYAQAIYNFGDSEETTGFVGNYYFHPHYFGTIYTNGTSMSGYISLNCPEEKKGENPHPALKGIYQYYMDSTGISIGSMALSDNPDLPYVMNYPSGLALWDSLEYLKPWNKQVIGFDPDGISYYVDDPYLVNDFSNNFNMSGSFQDQEPVGFGIDLIYEEEKLVQGTFYYAFKYGSANYLYPIPFHHFGEWSNATLDLVYETYHTID